MKLLLKGLLLIVMSVSLTGCGMMGNNEDDSNSEQQEPTSSDSDLSSSNQDDSDDNSESSSVSEDFRILSLMPSNTEILDALGFTESIVGISSVDTYPENLVENNDVAKIDAFEFDAEQVLNLEPTHIFSHESMRDMHEETLNQISEATGAEVVYVADADSIDGIYDTITEFGHELGATGEAEEVNAELESSVDSVIQQYENVSTDLDVFIQIGPYPEVFTSGSGTFIDDVLQKMNVKNTFSDIDGFDQVSAEEILDRNPDYIVSIIDGYDEENLENDVSQFSDSEGLHIADKERQCALDPDLLSRPGPRIDEGMEDLAECLFE
jgi:iron complex transport system substrate-binding protein